MYYLVLKSVKEIFWGWLRVPAAQMIQSKDMVAWSRSPVPWGYLADLGSEGDVECKGWLPCCLGKPDPQFQPLLGFDLWKDREVTVAKEVGWSHQDCGTASLCHTNQCLSISDQCLPSAVNTWIRGGAGIASALLGISNNQCIVGSLPKTYSLKIWY